MPKHLPKSSTDLYRTLEGESETYIDHSWHLSTKMVNPRMKLDNHIKIHLVLRYVRLFIVALNSDTVSFSNLQVL